MAGRIQDDKTGRCDVKVQAAFTTTTAVFRVEEFPTHGGLVEELDQAQKEAHSCPT